MVYCKNCGAQISDNASFCTNCGQKVEKDLVCRNCNSKQKPGTQFCPVCGTPVTEHRLPIQTPVKKPIKNLKKKILISAIAIVLVASIILGIMYVPGMINRNKTYKTDQGKAQKGTVVTVQTDNPVVQAEGITVDFGSFAPQENIELEISQVNGATDEEMGEALASYRLTVDDEEHTEFASFIGITIPIDMTNYDDIDVCATYYDEDTSKWVMLPHETSKEENKIIIYTDHFSDFSVFNISRSNTRFASASL
ncbi:MAG TPA: zinc ribbon domain-containing protein, partial [Clostridia bacterium]|nr:zinc ribbon domain-containing protein [Clostridia bacterium]